jgi:hypothetical protein
MCIFLGSVQSVPELHGHVLPTHGLQSSNILFKSLFMPNFFLVAVKISLLKNKPRIKLKGAF